MDFLVLLLTHPSIGLIFLFPSLSFSLLPPLSFLICLQIYIYMFFKIYFCWTSLLQARTRKNPGLPIQHCFYPTASPGCGSSLCWKTHQNPVDTKEFTSWRFPWWERCMELADASRGGKAVVRLGNVDNWHALFRLPTLLWKQATIDSSFSSVQLWFPAHRICSLGIRNTLIWAVKAGGWRPSSCICHRRSSN